MKSLPEGDGSLINETKKQYEDSDTLQQNFKGEEVAGLVSNMKTNLDVGVGGALPIPDMLLSTSTNKNTEEIIRDEQTIVLIPKSTMELSTMFSISRIPYDNGYGDFSFGRRVDVSMNALFQTFPTDEEMMSGSLLQSHKSDPSFQRLGLFPFFKLPIEIRNRIYRLLVGPCLHYDKQSKKSMMGIEVLTVQKDSELETYYGIGGEEGNLPDPVIEEEETGMKQEEGDIKAELRREARAAELNRRVERHLKKQKPHPYRKGKYNMRVEAFKLREGPILCGDNNDYYYLEWIRKLSNVSTAFRKELGDILWRRTSIRTFSNSASFQILYLLQNRPAGYSGLKCLSMSLDLRSSAWNDPETSMNDSAAPKFKQLCEFLARNFKLERFAIGFEIDAIDVEQIGSETSNLRFLTILRDVQISETFKMLLRVRLSEDIKKTLGAPATEAYWGAIDKLESELEEQWAPKLKGWIMPNVLRSSPPPTDMENYLQSRSKAAVKKPLVLSQ